MRNYWNLRSGEFVFLFLFFTATPCLAQAQFSKPEEKFPAEETYLYPIYPGQPGSLAGTMGELRTTHFHSGIDIRTNNMIGMPVRASKSGYISRITSSGVGYGNVIYITHPDGNTTLYAHLDKFKGAIAQHILEEQYRLKSGEIDLYFKPHQFTVNRGDTIGLSGNSGSSGGPHLHYDIRDAENNALDPIKVAGFSELVDKYPPAAEKIALRTLDIHSRVNDRFGRFEFYAQRVGNDFIIANPISVTGNIGVEIIAKDKLAYNSQFFGGVNYIELKVDSQLIFKQAIDKVNIAETRAIYTLMDFKTMRNKGTRFYKLYIDDGNSLKFYNESPGSGKIKVNPAKQSTVEIKMNDSNGNASYVSFHLKPEELAKEVPTLENLKEEVSSDVVENILMITAKPCAAGNKAKIHRDGIVKEIEPDYYNQNQAVYLIDLRSTIPDSVTLCDKSFLPKINATVPSGTEYKFYGNIMDITFPGDAIYDTLYLHTNYTLTPGGNEIYTIGTRTVPLNKSILVSLKTRKEYPRERNLSVYRVAGRGYTYLGGEWENDRINFHTREFGDFMILQDSTPPTIRPVFVNSSSARFKIKDNLSGIDRFEATLNEEWVLMHYDNKNAVIWSETLNKKIPMRGVFELKVTDNAGNTSTFKQKIP
ncbi:M23 family metallopeptidase [Chryseolinea sp. H1M3-3]|uniref:M23 family metallopeptidase n=1 Tax=Chryseolinea sp. H1M3-3 TaxID=3034144 RepID=UPI0023EB5E43|nr:M23 family metallopeptidase [Chryseolinea sp. H1M3-3]